MEFLADFFLRFLVQFQSPTLGFLIGGMVIAALGSNLKIPSANLSVHRIYASDENRAERGVLKFARPI